MKRITVFIGLMLILSCVIACSSQENDLVENTAMTSAVGSRGTPQISERQKQINEVASHIKFDKDTFFIDISIEEAMQRGVSADIYNHWLERLEEHTLKARKIIAEGGKYYFVNGFMQSESLSNNPNYRMGYSGNLQSPGFERGYLKIIKQHSGIHIGVAFTCNAKVVSKDNQEGFAPAVWHECTVSGEDSIMGTVTTGVTGLGTPYYNSPPVPIPGVLGEEVLHVITYKVKPEFLQEGDTLKYGWCTYFTTTYI